MSCSCCVRVAPCMQARALGAGCSTRQHCTRLRTAQAHCRRSKRAHNAQDPGPCANGPMRHIAVYGLLWCTLAKGARTQLQHRQPRCFVSRPVLLILLTNLFVFVARPASAGMPRFALTDSALLSTGAKPTLSLSAWTCYCLLTDCYSQPTFVRLFAGCDHQVVRHHKTKDKGTTGFARPLCTYA